MTRGADQGALVESLNFCFDIRRLTKLGTILFAERKDLTPSMKTFSRIEKELGILVTFMKPGGLKLNLDAAARTGFPMAAVTGRNDQGTTLHLWTSMHLTSNPLVAEARAALLAVQQASCLNQEQILCEGDALLVCNAINDDSIEPDWKIDPIVRDIRSYLVKDPGWKFCAISRQANSQAHRLFALGSIH